MKVFPFPSTCCLLLFAGLILWGCEAQDVNVTGPPTESSSSSSSSEMMEYISSVLNEVNEEEAEGKHMTPEEKWILTSRRLERISGLVVDKLVLFAGTVLRTITVSPECAGGILKVLVALQNRQTWAYKMMDSFGSLFPRGLMSGTIASFGDYDQCLAIRSPTGSVRGKYCLLTMRPPVPPMKKRLQMGDLVLNFTGTELEGTVADAMSTSAWAFYSSGIVSGLCVPSVCSAHEVEGIAAQILKIAYINVTVGPDCASLSDEVPLHTTQLVALVGISIALAAVVVGTIFHKYPTQNKRINSLTECFAIDKNWCRIFVVTEGDPKLRWMHGVRFFMLVYIIFSHSYTLGTMFAPEISYRILDEFIPRGRTFAIQVVMNGWLGIDTFFIMSGLLTVYIGLPQFERLKGHIGFFQFTFLRFVRFAPSIAGIIALNVLWPLFGSGPVMRRYAKETVENCYTHWWATLLYVSNWLHPNDICLRHSWYFSADFQFHVLMYFFLLAFLISPKNTLHASGLMVVMGMAIPAAIVYYFDLPPTTLLAEADIQQLRTDLRYFYLPTCNHFAPFFIGVLLGYVLLKDIRPEMPKKFKKLLWSTLPLGSIAILFSVYIWNGLEVRPDRVSSTLYAGSHRLIWSLGNAWVYYHIAIGECQYLYRILSAKVWVPFSRLSMQMLLSHFLLIWYHYSTTRIPIMGDHYNMFFLATSFFVWTFALSVVTYILFEAPYYQLMKLLLMSPEMEIQPPKSTQQLNNGECVTQEAASNVDDTNDLNIASGSKVQSLTLSTLCSVASVNEGTTDTFEKDCITIKM